MSNVLDFNLDDRRFDDLVEAAQSRLPALAPQWTDYNLHDPGITLIEMMAWLSEAQIYALARMRRDERAAYAAYAGIALAGPQPARGLIWPDASDPASLVNTRVQPVALGDANPIRPVDSDRPLARVPYPTLIVPGRITALTSFIGGERVDRTAGNARGQIAYLPFGADAGPRDRLRIDYLCRSENGLADRDSADLGALLTLGVRNLADAAVPADTSTPGELEATLSTGGAQHILAIASDSSAALSRSGVIALRLPATLPAAQSFSIELRSPRSFVCPPRVWQIALNVIEVEQSVRIDHELHVATGQVDQVVELNEAGLRIDTATPLQVDVEAGATTQAWRAVRRFDTAGPADAVYQLDAEHGRLVFGNGINGSVPPAGARIFASYSATDGAAGSQPRARSWFASGLGPIGRNLDAIAGGSDAETLQQARTAARRAVRERHALVTSADIVAAALASADLHVARALVVDASANDPPGSVTLIALRERFVAGAALTEPQRWLAALQATLQPRLPLGQRLLVIGPSYADFALQATLQAAPLRELAAIQAAALAELARRLGPIAGERTLGAALTSSDIGAWLKRIDGVSAVTSVLLRDSAGKPVDAVAVGRYGLPRFDAAKVTINVVRGTARNRS